MKFSFGLETFDVYWGGPNAQHMWSKSYWDDIYKLVSTAGFKAIELPCNPYARELNRSGIPISQITVKRGYGSVGLFRESLYDFGIEEISSVYIKANSVIYQLLMSGKDTTKYFEVFKSLIPEALEYLQELGGHGLVISPTPEIGVLLEYTGGMAGVEDYKKQLFPEIIEYLNDIAKTAAKNDIKIVIKNEFWSLIRGYEIDKFLKGADPGNIFFSPDTAHLAIAGIDPLEIIQKYKGKMDFVHFSDTSFIDNEDLFAKANAEIGPHRVFCDIGDGAVNLTEIYKSLEENGYDGWAICESKKTLNIYRALLKMRRYLDRSFL